MVLRRLNGSCQPGFAASIAHTLKGRPFAKACKAVLTAFLKSHQGNKGQDGHIYQ
ncbi:hypothetical protein X474_07020 [Dethiosulfatarculus sandiegensis]|uniref:Uncharacterized protein n=1 Tax=Dethiosulfatarculus sandiegensis TaxID=1429043 RepID=A0A0D2GJC7_9BACT|nr:hypothetical protein X474_07020 [Dethiosulfatarculus sandiegensis]